MTHHAHGAHQQTIDRQLPVHMLIASGIPCSSRWHAIAMMALPQHSITLCPRNIRQSADCRAREPLTNHVCRVEQQQYRVDVSDSKKEAATVQCHFSRTRDLMFVLLPREVGLLPLR